MTSGNPLVVDTSALLSIYFEEPTASWAAEQLERHSGSLIMSMVNVTEVMIVLGSRRAWPKAQIETRLQSSGIRFVSPSVEHARLAAAARLRFPINLGDCFCYALSALEDCAILTLDEDFQRCDRPLIFPDA
jgi:ribonuclease VapC